jgi:hypothetical protein
MIQANLIPIPRRLARRRRTRVRRWATFCTAYCVLLVATYGVLQAMWGRGDHVEHDVQTVASEITTTERDVKVVQPKLNEARLTLAASMAVGSQPDWSVLLALLAKQMHSDWSEARGLLARSMEAASAMTAAPPTLVRTLLPLAQDAARQIVLSSCALEPLREGVAPPSATAAQSAAATQPKYTLVLTGMGRSQAAISQYVLRLEQTGLFDRVTLIESKRGPFAGGEAVSFRIGCGLGSR